MSFLDKLPLFHSFVPQCPTISTFGLHPNSRDNCGESIPVKPEFFFTTHRVLQFWVTRNFSRAMAQTRASMLRSSLKMIHLPNVQTGRHLDLSSSRQTLNKGTLLANKGNI